VEFVRWLQYYRLLRNIAPQTTSLIDLYDEEHFSVPKNPKSFAWHAGIVKNLTTESTENRSVKIKYQNAK